MNRRRFESLVTHALDSIPEEFLRRVENLTIQVVPWADEESLATMGIEDPHDLLGEYRGVPLGERGIEYPPELPDVIILYQGAIEACAQASGVAVGQVVRETLVHELAHYFGFSEEEMERIEAIWAEGR